jgi:integrase
MNGATLTVAVDRFLTHRRALGRKYLSEQAELVLLMRFADARSVENLDGLTPELLDEFLASRPRSRPRSFNHLLGVVAVFLDWAVSQQLLAESPLCTRRRRVTAERIPFLFDPAQVRRLLDLADRLADNPRARARGVTYHAIFALCYGLGLRAGETCGLRVGDVDTERQLLVVRGGKFGKTRLVPHGPSIGQLLAEQLQRRRSGEVGLAADAPLFTFDGHRCVHPGSASQTFHRLLPELELDVPAGVASPRLHSLRHSFAVSTLLRWYRQGDDPSARLFELSTFMGHVDPTSTAVYLTITTELFDEANRRFEAFAAPAWNQGRR